MVSSLITGKCSEEEEIKTATVAQPLCHYTVGVCSSISSGFHHRNKRRLKIKHFYIPGGGFFVCSLSEKVTLSLLL